MVKQKDDIHSNIIVNCEGITHVAYSNYGQSIHLYDIYDCSPVLVLILDVTQLMILFWVI